MNSKVKCLLIKKEKDLEIALEIIKFPT